MATTRPITAYKMVFFALVTAVVSPFETVYLMPPITIIITAMAPKIIEEH
mgnify:CR=1 FL=1